MPRKQVYTKSQIPKWYKRRIKQLEELSDIEAIYEYERIKLEERVRRARKKGYQYNLEPRIPRGQRTAYDIADVQAITSADIRQVQVYNRVQEAEYWFSQLKDYVYQESENQAEGWIETRTYKRGANKGSSYKSGSWLAENVRKAGRDIIRAIDKIMSDASTMTSVYNFYLVGSKYQTLTDRIQKVLADSNTAAGKYGLLNSFLSELSMKPMTAEEGQRSDALSTEDADEYDDDYD